MHFEPFREIHLQQLPILQPDGWSSIVPAFQFYLQQPFCHPVCVVEAERVIGVGACIVHRKTAWLAHIIVHPDERNRGIGKTITDMLIEIIGKQSQIETILLIATKLGAPVYRKSGFEDESDYVFYKDGAILSTEVEGVVRCADAQFENVIRLDQKISGEDRTEVLSLHRNECWVKLINQKIDGFYLPTLGDGLVVAQSAATGIELMMLRGKREVKFILPEQNVDAADFLIRYGYQTFQRGTRMRLGKKIEWYPEKIFNRISGSMG